MRQCYIFAKSRNLELNNNTAAGNLTISCTPGTHISVAFNKGAKQHAQYRDLERREGFDSLDYIICTDPGCQNIWGDGTNGTIVVQHTFPPGVSTVNIPIYAKIPPGQEGMGGNYLDHVIISITF